jgi:hypothetical protein
MKRKSKPTLRVQLENSKAENQYLKDRKASLEFDMREIEMLKHMCSHMEEYFKNPNEGDVSDINSIAKEYNEEQREVVRNIYFKASFK